VVDAVDEIDVREAAGLPHVAVAVRRPEAGVAREVALAQVRLDLREPAAEDRAVRETAAQRPAEQVARDRQHRAAEERGP